jgi:hypothetical protein
MVSRRTVLKAPAVTLAAAVPGVPGPQRGEAARFTPLDLASRFNAGAREFGAHWRWRDLQGESHRDGLVRAPSGRQTLQGIPFLLGSGGIDAKTWVLLGSRGAEKVEVPTESARAGFLCLAAFCDWDQQETPSPDSFGPEQVGQALGRAVLVYEDGAEHAFGLRRRFEVNSPAIYWGRQPFNALTHLKHQPAKLTDPLESAVMWGELQTQVWDNCYPQGNPALVWISAHENPRPDQPIRAIRFESAAANSLAICGATLYHGREHPLRHERLTTYRLQLPEAAADPARWKAEVDLGVVARAYALPPFEPEQWLASPVAARGRHGQPAAGQLFLEITASREATLSLTDTQTGQAYSYELAALGPAAGGPRVEVIEPHKTWVHGQVLAGGKPSPVRIAFRSADGRYIPPYGHAAQPNPYWFQDYGGDLQLGADPFAYIDGTFQAELPVGEVYVEISKGFEYQPVRQRLGISAGQRELKLEIPRLADWRSRGWMTADTHVHFLSPSTALLEAHAEGLNLINLLASQWRDLFTNVGDLYGGTLSSPDGEAMVWVGTENRQHLLGHLGLLGGHGEPVYPMCAGGPGESYLGDPVHHSLAAWADACRKRDGVVVAVHFPYPNGELAADIALGKIDAVELYPYGSHMHSSRFLEWYRYLNCGYRLAAVGGTDKMGGYMPAGANRTYAYLGGQPLTYAAWAGAVRAGRTFMTTGPLLELEVDGRLPGDEIRMPAGGGSIEVRARAVSAVPIHRIEIVLNGRVAATREEKAGTRELTLKEAVAVSGPGWVAARCSSTLGGQSAWPFGIHAHTSPVYLAEPGSELFSPESAGYMLTLIDGAESWTRTLATRPERPEQFAAVLRVFEDARARLKARK